MKNKKLILAVLAFALISVMLAFSAMATDAAATTGYTFDTDGKTYTNIKWTQSTDGSDKIVTFEIDAAAADKKASTVLCGFDPVTGKAGGYSSPIANGWGTNFKATKIVIGAGITELKGGVFTMLNTIKSVELPASLTTISGTATFEGCHALSAIFITGTEKAEGVYDLSGITTLTAVSYNFDNTGRDFIKSIKFNPALKGEFGVEFIKNIAMKELEIPEGVTKLADKSLSMTKNLQTLTILGMDTVINSDAVFNGNSTYPVIKAKAGSKAAEFALANGYTFIDLDTGAETKGTKPVTVAATPSTGTTTGTTSGTTSGSTGSASTTGFPIGLDAFNPDEATAYGLVDSSTYYIPIGCTIRT